MKLSGELTICLEVMSSSGNIRAVSLLDEKKIQFSKEFYVEFQYGGKMTESWDCEVFSGSVCRMLENPMLYDQHRLDNTEYYQAYRDIITKMDMGEVEFKKLFIPIVNDMKQLLK